MLDHFYFKLIYKDISKKMNQSRALHIMASIMILIYALQFLGNYKENWVMLLVLLPPALLILYYAIFKKKEITSLHNNLIFRIFEIGILLMASFRFFAQSQLFPTILFISFAIFLIIILYIENRFFSNQYIDVTSDGIDIALPTHTKSIKWSSAENVILKDDYFSIVTKQKGIWQYPISNSLTDDEMNEFLLFCKKQLAIK